MYLLAFRLIKACAEIFHNFSVAADAACTGIAAGDDFTENGDIGINAVIALSTGKTDTEACYNLVTNKKSTILAAKCLNALREILINRACCRFRAARLNEHSCRAAAEFIKNKLLFKAFKIIREEFLSVLEYEKRNTV